MTQEKIDEEFKNLNLCISDSGIINASLSFEKENVKYVLMEIRRMNHQIYHVKYCQEEDEICAIIFVFDLRKKRCQCEEGYETNYYE